MSTSMEQITESQLKPSLSLGSTNKEASGRPMKSILYFGPFNDSIDTMSELASRLL